MQRSTSKLPLVMEKNPASPLAESYRVLRTSLDFLSSEQALQTIAVTSAGQGEGKSTTAVNLAIALTQAERSVLLIDANFRQPALHDVFVKPLHQGLSNILAKQCNLQDAVEITHIERLSLLTAGTQPPNPSELLASSNFIHLLEEAREMYDIVLIDSPPVLLATDAPIIASRCHGVLLVVHAGKTKKQAVHRAQGVLRNGKANVLGIVLNKVRKKRREKEFVYFDSGYVTT